VVWKCPEEIFNIGLHPNAQEEIVKRLSLQPSGPDKVCC